MCRDEHRFIVGWVGARLCWVIIILASSSAPFSFYSLLVFARRPCYLSASLRFSGASFLSLFLLWVFIWSSSHCIHKLADSFSCVLLMSPSLSVSIFIIVIFLLLAFPSNSFFLFSFQWAEFLLFADSTHLLLQIHWLLLCLRSLHPFSCLAFRMPCHLWGSFFESQTSFTG